MVVVVAPRDEVVRRCRLLVDARGARVLAVEAGAVGAARVVIIPPVLAGALAAVPAVVRAVLVVQTAIAVTVADAKNLPDKDQPVR